MAKLGEKDGYLQVVGVVGEQNGFIPEGIPVCYKDMKTGIIFYTALGNLILKGELDNYIHFLDDYTVEFKIVA